MNYEVTYSTVNGRYSFQCKTLLEAENYAAAAKRAKAAGVKVTKLS